jgi:hypothetical protein
MPLTTWLRVLITLNATTAGYRPTPHKTPDQHLRIMMKMLTSARVVLAMHALTDRASAMEEWQTVMTSGKQGRGEQTWHTLCDTGGNHRAFLPPRRPIARRSSTGTRLAFYDLHTRVADGVAGAGGEVDRYAGWRSTTPITSTPDVRAFPLAPLVAINARRDCL